jgi:hypothetical protein
MQLFITANSGKPVNKKIFARLFTSAWKSAMTINNITSGFSSTGLYSIDSSKILDKLKPSEPFYKPPTSPLIASILAIPTVSQTESTNKNTSKLLKVSHARVLTDSALVEALKQNKLEIKRKEEEKQMKK